MGPYRRLSPSPSGPAFSIYRTTLDFRVTLVGLRTSLHLGGTIIGPLWPMTYSPYPETAGLAQLREEPGIRYKST